MDIEGKRAIVTGGGSGFGYALMKRLVADGARVAVFDCDESRLATIRSEHPQVLALSCDVSDADQVDNAVARVFENFAGVEILVNNAGIMHSAPLINMLDREDRRHSLDLWHRVIRVNQDSVFLMTRTVVDQMLARRNKGVVVNISSIAARGNAGQTAYSASKAAVEAMTKVWSKELGRLGIRCVGVAPGFIDSAGTSAAIEEKMLQRWVEQTPLRRTGRVDEIIESIVFAIENDFINGEILSINGGLVV